MTMKQARKTYQRKFSRITAVETKDGKGEVVGSRVQRVWDDPRPSFREWACKEQPDDARGKLKEILRGGRR